jgi:hypothetical protein
MIRSRTCPLRIKTFAPHRSTPKFQDFTHWEPQKLMELVGWFSNILLAINPGRTAIFKIQEGLKLTAA